MSIIHKNEKFDYFEAFERMTKDASVAACFLNETLIHFKYECLSTYVKEIHIIENHADSYKHEIVERLAHEFMTPIEREDIVELSQALDTVVDSLDDVVRRMYMFDIHKIRGEMLDFSQLIVKSCKVLESVVKEFRNFKSSKTIMKLIVDVNTFENEGDDLHLKYLHMLFSEETSDRSLLIWMTIFEALESCCDAFEDVADIIESIIMKNT